MERESCLSYFINNSLSTGNYRNSKPQICLLCHGDYAAMERSGEPFPRATECQLSSQSLPSHKALSRLETRSESQGDGEVCSGMGIAVSSFHCSQRAEPGVPVWGASWGTHFFSSKIFCPDASRKTLGCTIMLQTIQHSHDSCSPMLPSKATLTQDLTCDLCPQEAHILVNKFYHLTSWKANPTWGMSANVGGKPWM